MRSEKNKAVSFEEVYHKYTETLQRVAQLSSELDSLGKSKSELSEEAKTLSSQIIPDASTRLASLRTAKVDRLVGKL